jgi:hypothetical protein
MRPSLIVTNFWDFLFPTNSSDLCLGLALEPGVFQELHQTMRKFPGAAAIIKGAPGSNVLRRRKWGDSIKNRCMTYMI